MSIKGGPRKKLRSRIRQKTEKDYGGDVARVVDLERATGIFDSVDDLELRHLAAEGRLAPGRDHDPALQGPLRQEVQSGYRDLQLNVELDGFVGELQLNLRRIIEVKAKAHTIYEVERVIEAKEDKDAVQRAVEGPGLESEQVLRLSDRRWPVDRRRVRISRRVRGGAGAGAAARLRVANVYSRRKTRACGWVSTRSTPWPGCGTTSSSWGSFADCNAVDAVAVELPRARLAAKAGQVESSHVSSMKVPRRPEGRRCFRALTRRGC